MTLQSVGHLQIYRYYLKQVGLDRNDPSKNVESVELNFLLTERSRLCSKPGLPSRSTCR